MAKSIDEFAAEFGVRPTQKPQGLRAEVATPQARQAKRKKRVDTRNLRQKMRDRRKLLDQI